MDLKLIQRLVRLMKAGEVTELEIEDKEDGLKVRLQRGPKADVAGASPVVQVLGGTGGSMPMSAPAAPAASAPAEEPAAAGGIPAGTKEVLSPMVGTFYRAASPDQDPFADVGTMIGEGKVLCIVEAMKVMNEIKAEFSGEIIRLLVENGEPVEFGQPLFLVKTS